MITQSTQIYVFLCTRIIRFSYKKTANEENRMRFEQEERIMRSRCYAVNVRVHTLLPQTHVLQHDGRKS